MKTKLLVTLILIFNLTSFAEDVKKPTTKQMKSGVELMLSQYDWTVFWKEFSVSTNLKTCHTSDISQGFIGFKATLIEPLYLVDTTVVNNEIPSLKVEIGKNQHDKTGTTLNDGGVYVNVFRFPLLGMIFKEINKDGVFAFEKGNPSLVYLGKIDPKKWNDVLAYALNPERDLWASIEAVLASIASCVSNTTLATFSNSYIREEGSLGQELRGIIDGYTYSLGCIGEIPTGTITTHPNPIVTSKKVIASVLYDMFTKKGLVNGINVNHTTLNVLNGYDQNLYCKSKTNPVMPITQFTSQLLYPVVGETLEFGVSPMNYSFSIKNDATKVIMVINQRRDYAAFAYQD